MIRTHTRQANDQLALAWQKAIAEGKLVKARRISTAWKVVEAMVLAEEAESEQPAENAAA